MPLTDDQIAALRDLGQLGSRILGLRDRIARLSQEILLKQTEKSSLQTKLQQAKQEFQDQWEVLKQ